MEGWTINMCTVHDAHLNVRIKVPQTAKTSFCLNRFSIFDSMPENSKEHIKYIGMIYVTNLKINLI